MGTTLTKDEEAVEKLLQALLYKKDPNYDSNALRELLKWSKAKDLIPNVSAAFEVSTWDTVGLKLLKEISKGTKEVKKFPLVWRLLVEALREAGAERRVSLCARAALDGGSGVETEVSESKTSAEQLVFSAATAPLLAAARKILGFAPAAAAGSDSAGGKAGTEPEIPSAAAPAQSAALSLPAAPLSPGATTSGSAPASPVEPAQSATTAAPTAPALSAPPAVIIAHASGTEPAVTSSSSTTTSEATVASFAHALRVAPAPKCHPSQARSKMKQLSFGTPGQPPGPRVRNAAVQRAADTAPAGEQPTSAVLAAANSLKPWRSAPRPLPSRRFKLYRRRCGRGGRSRHPRHGNGGDAPETKAAAACGWGHIPRATAAVCKQQYQLLVEQLSNP